MSKVCKSAVLKLIIGLVILIPLTCELLGFYSFTFYSAFSFHYDMGDICLSPIYEPIKIAYSRAWETGVTEVFYSLIIPTLIMLLGFSVHFYKIQKTWRKYLKIVVVLCFIFIYNFILAYKIGCRVREMDVIIGTAELNSTYGLVETISDV